MIKITTKCSFCHQKFVVDSEFLGKKVRCTNPVCKKGFVVEEYSANGPVHNSGNEYKSSSDDVLAPPVSSPRISETPFKNTNFVSPAEVRMRTQKSYEGAPSYWALKVISILLDAVGTIVLISPLFAIENYSDKIPGSIFAAAIFCCAVVGIIIIGIAQLLAAIRDMARNSFG